MMIAEIAFFTVILLIGGYVFTRDKFNFRRWLFIIVLFFLFLMVGVSGSQFASDVITGNASSEANNLTEGLTLLGFGILGLGLLIAFYRKKSLELSTSFGLSGVVLTLTGLVITLESRPVSVKFFATLICLIIVSFLVHKYRDTLFRPPTAPPAPKPESMKFCKNCGAPIEKGDKFCSKCGFRIYTRQKE